MLNVGKNGIGQNGESKLVFVNKNGIWAKWHCEFSICEKRSLF